MRVFFAIEFSSEIKDYLYSVQQQIKKFCNGGNFSHKDNFHLTLRFIGEQSPEQIDRLKPALHDAASEFGGFELKLSSIGNFKKGNKKIIWAGIERSSQLQNLYQKLEGILESKGYAREERGYSPHITLVREARINDEGLKSNSFSENMPIIKVKSISLMESTRINNKLTYTAIEKAELVV